MFEPITVESFPAESFAWILAESQKPNFKNAVYFELTKASNAALTEEKLRTFSEMCGSLNPEIRIYFYGIEQIQAEKGLLFLRQYALMNRLKDSCFAELAVLSEESATLVLQDEVLRTRLNALKLGDPRGWVEFGQVDKGEVYDPQAMRQTFRCSCAARVILNILFEAGWISDKDCTPSKELEIYQQTWVSPGKYTHPEKMIHFLSRFFERSAEPAIKAYDMQERRKWWLKQASDAACIPSSSTSRELVRSSFSLFKTLLKDDLIKIKSGEKINEDLFKPGIISLLIHTACDGGTHTVFGQRRSSGRFEIIDPGLGTRIDYPSFADYVANKQKFMGIIINIQLNRSFPKMFHAYQNFLCQMGQELIDSPASSVHGFNVGMI